MTDRLQIYNNALGILGARALTSEYENRPNRKVLDEFWALNIVQHCLELAKPKFALEVAKLATPVVDADTSYDNVYTLPADYVCIVGVYSDEALQNKVERYLLGNGTIATEVATNIYLRYICNSRAYSLWTPGFSRLVPAYLASESATRIAPDKQEYALKNFTDHLNVVLEVEGVKEVEPQPLKAIHTLATNDIRIYNGVARLLGQPLIISTTDQSPLRVAIDYALGPVGQQATSSLLSAALQIARPRFAAVSAILTPGAASVLHGYTNVHNLPANFIDVVSVHSDASLDIPINRYLIEGRTIATNFTSVYLRYLTAAPTSTEWSPAFMQFFCAHVALELAPGHAFGDSAGERVERIKALRMVYDERLQVVQATESISEPQPRSAKPEFAITETWRGIYNRTMSILDLEPILSITDDSARRHRLDSLVNSKLIDTLLSKIAWNFAAVREELVLDGTYVAEMGWNYRYTLPVTVHRIDMISTNTDFRCSSQYLQEPGYIYSNDAVLYIRYVTTAMLTTPDLWPQYFRDYVSAEFAVAASGLPNANARKAYAEHPKIFREATNTDASRNPVKPQRPGSWNSARGGSNRGRIRNGVYTQDY